MIAFNMTRDDKPRTPPPSRERIRRGVRSFIIGELFLNLNEGFSLVNPRVTGGTYRRETVMEGFLMSLAPHEASLSDIGGIWEAVQNKGRRGLCTVRRNGPHLSFQISQSAPCRKSRSRGPVNFFIQGSTSTHTLRRLVLTPLSAQIFLRILISGLTFVQREKVSKVTSGDVAFPFQYQLPRPKTFIKPFFIAHNRGGFDADPVLLHSTIVKYVQSQRN
jgi:hypothetical protein